jgi:CheY-like chemotaxis protein
MSAAVAKSVPGSVMSFRRPDGEKCRVLYAEDQASARTVTTALLERMGFDVEAVEDGELAFEKAKQNAYDVILLDIEMPVMDGVTAARHIRLDAAPCKGVPILALSAFLADSTEHSVWRDAFDSALPKPANGNELQTAMRKALRKSTEGKPDTSLALHWTNLSASLPKGTLRLLVQAAGKEIVHQIVAYSACREVGDLETARHCLRSLKGIATSFEISGLSALLTEHEEKSDWPAATDLLREAREFRIT